LPALVDLELIDRVDQSMLSKSKGSINERISADIEAAAISGGAA
jgi:hypothetical protein